jgi:benzylsuccinate CoA-transferase BbsF subunit
VKAVQSPESSVGPLHSTNGLALDRGPVLGPWTLDSGLETDMRPLEGIRVCDFTWVWAGPFGTLQLAHLGADVIKIESARRTDTTRGLVPADDRPGVNRGGYFNQYNQGKRSIALDLGTEEGRDIARRLVAVSDIVAENFSAGVMQRFGLDYDSLRRVKPDLIMISLSGYGATGPLSPYISYGPAQVPMSGLAGLTGYAGGPPSEVGISYGDPNGGIHGTVAVLAALWHRQRTGEGQYIDESQWEAALAMLPEGLLAQVLNGRPPERRGNRDGVRAPHGIFPCAEPDTWVSIACGSDAEFAALCGAIGQPDLALDERFATAAARKVNEDDLEAIVSGWTRDRDRWDVTRVLQAAGVAAYPAMTSADLLADDHLAARGLFTRLNHAEVGVRAHVGIPWHLSETPCTVERPAPLQGEHTDAVLREVLHLSDAEIAGLRERRILT